jgi:hypothetical protein
MSDQPELDSLIVSHLADLEDALVRLEEFVEPRLGGGVNDILERFMSRTGWPGKADWSENHLWVAPTSWRTEEGSSRDDFGAYFEFEIIPGQDEAEDYYSITSLAGVGSATYGLRWNQNQLNKTQWKKFIQAQTERLDNLRKKGFHFDARSKRIHYPVRVDHARLVEAFREDSFDEALAPLVAALEAALASEAAFEELLGAARA